MEHYAKLFHGMSLSKGGKAVESQNIGLVIPRVVIALCVLRSGDQVWRTNFNPVADAVCNAW